MSVKVHEAFSLDSFQDRLLFFDDFHGDQLQDEWRGVGTGSVAVVDAQTGGIVRLTTGANANDTYQVDWADIRSLLVTKKATMEVRAKLTQTTNVVIWLYLYNGVNDRFGFEYDSAIGANYLIRTRAGGVGNAVDSGTAADTDEHIFRFESHTHGANHIHFYLDGVETTNSPIATNITALYLQPILFILTRENVAKSMDVDYVYLREER